MMVTMNMKMKRSNSQTKISGKREEIFQVRQREYTGHAVAFFRRILNLTQRELALRIPCSVDSIGRIERSEQDPTFQEICMISMAIGVTPIDLCSPDWGFHEKSLIGKRTEDFISEVQIEMLHQEIKDGISMIKCGRFRKEAGTDVIDSILGVLRFCVCPRTKKEIREYCGYSSDAYFRQEVLYPLMEAGLLQRTEKTRPSSPGQKYKITIES